MPQTRLETRTAASLTGRDRRKIPASPRRTPRPGWRPGSRRPSEADASLLLVGCGSSPTGRIAPT